MVWVTFTEDFNWRASRRGMVQYRKGQNMNVPRRCADQAVAEGKAVVDRPEAKPGDDQAADEAAPVVEVAPSEVTAAIPEAGNAG